MILGIDPKVDFAFKYLFGQEKNLPILINVLNSTLNPPPGRLISKLLLRNPFNLKDAKDDKLSILDIKACDETGRQFNVEMQIRGFPHFSQRILYYGCRLHQDQLLEGEDYRELQPTISISFLDFVLFPNVSDYHLRFRLLEQSHHFPLTDDLEFRLFQLPRFTKSAQELSNSLDVWLYFLRYAEKIDTEELPVGLDFPLVHRAMEELKMLAQNDQERELYESRRKAQLDRNSLLNAERREGRHEGVLEGLRKTILHLGRKRFGPPPAAIPTTLENIVDLERLEALSERLLDATSWEDLLGSL